MVEEFRLLYAFIADSSGKDDRVLWAEFGLLQLFMAQFRVFMVRSSYVVDLTQQQKVLLLS